ncbi:MAG: DUF998 domain-containing protein, partial [Pirellulaceae bacterium]
FLVSSLFYPGYSHVTQYARELGSAKASGPMIFNGGISITGVASVVVGFGFYGALISMGSNRALSALLGLSVILLGASAIMAGVFPMPDPRHGAFGMGMGIHLSPMFLALALHSDSRFRGLTIYLWVTFVLMLVFFVIMMGVGGLVTTSNVGVFQRLNALNMFPWIGIASWMLAGTGMRRASV